MPAVPCHNDLSAGNVLDDGERLWLIDFEYAADAEPAAELGNAIGMSGLPFTAVEQLVTAYRGEPDQLLTDRAMLFHTLSITTWIPWMILQDAAHPGIPRSPTGSSWTSAPSAPPSPARTYEPHSAESKTPPENHP